MVYIKGDIHAPSRTCQKKHSQNRKSSGVTLKTQCSWLRGNTEPWKAVLFCKMCSVGEVRRVPVVVHGLGGREGMGMSVFPRRCLWPGCSQHLPEPAHPSSPTHIPGEGCLQMLVGTEAICRERERCSVVSKWNGDLWTNSSHPTPLFPGQKRKAVLGCECWGISSVPCVISTSLTQKIWPWHWLWGLGELSKNTSERNLSRRSQVCVVLWPLEWVGWQRTCQCGRMLHVLLVGSSNSGPPPAAPKMWVTDSAGRQK